MEDLFGVKMDHIMIVLLVVFLPSLAIISVMALRNRVMLKMALRNIPRRKAQTALIVTGIMISTLIMAASFGTGDTLTFSIRNAVIDGLGTIDEFVLSARAGENDQFGGAAYVPMERFTSLQQELADVDTIDGLAPGLAEIAPTVNDRTSRSEGRMQIAGVNPDTLQGFGGFRLEDGSDVRVEDLGPSQVFINTAAAENLEAVPGDMLTVYVYGEPAALTVKGVVSGGGPVGAEPTLLLHLNKAQELFGRVGFINSIVVSNKGDEYTAAPNSATRLPGRCGCFSPIAKWPSNSRRPCPVPMCWSNWNSGGSVRAFPTRSGMILSGWRRSYPGRSCPASWSLSFPTTAFGPSFCRRSRLRMTRSFPARSTPSWSPWRSLS